MSAISNFREPVRVLIGDNDPDIPLREDAQIDAALRTVIDLGKVSGTQPSGYAVNEARTEIVPDLTPASDAKAFAQLVYHASKLFVTDLAPTSWRTRAFSESIGEQRDKVFHLLEDLYQLEHGGMGASSDYE